MLYSFCCLHLLRRLGNAWYFPLELVEFVFCNVFYIMTTDRTFFLQVQFFLPKVDCSTDNLKAKVIKKYIPYHDRRWGLDESDPTVQKRCLARMLLPACSRHRRHVYNYIIYISYVYYIVILFMICSGRVLY